MNPFRRNRLLACAVPPLLWSPCQYVPVLKNILPTGISSNPVVLSTLRAVLLTHHLQHLNLARPRAGKSETAGTPAGPLPAPWHSPTADIQLDMVVWCVGCDFMIQRGVDCRLIQQHFIWTGTRNVVCLILKKPVCQCHL